MSQNNIPHKIGIELIIILIAAASVVGVFLGTNITLSTLDTQHSVPVKQEAEPMIFYNQTDTHTTMQYGGLEIAHICKETGGSFGSMVITLNGNQANFISCTYGGAK